MFAGVGYVYRYHHRHHRHHHPVVILVCLLVWEKTSQARSAPPRGARRDRRDKRMGAYLGRREGGAFFFGVSVFARSLMDAAVLRPMRAVSSSVEAFCQCQCQCLNHPLTGRGALAVVPSRTKSVV